VDWRRGWIGVLLWPEGWPQRQGKQLGYTALYIVFDFVNPAVEVGFNIPGAGVGATQAAWPPVLAAFAEAGQTLGDRYELVTDTGDLANPTAVSPAATVDTEWLLARMGTMTTTARMRLRRRVDPLTVTVSQVRDLVLALRDDINSIADNWWAL